MDLNGQGCFPANQVSLEINTPPNTGMKTFASSASAFDPAEAMPFGDHWSDEFDGPHIHGLYCVFLSDRKS